MHVVPFKQQINCCGTWKRDVEDAGQRNTKTNESYRLPLLSPLPLVQWSGFDLHSLT